MIWEPFFETSAKNNGNIKEIFDLMLNEINGTFYKKTELKL